jgi:hypothetical protein
VYLVSNKPRCGPRVLPPVYSDAVRLAIHEIRRVHRDEEAKLTIEDRIDLANALHLLAVAAMLEGQLVPLDIPS